MDTFGPAMLAPLKRNSRGATRRVAASIAAIALAAGLVGGCTTTFKLGAPPPVEKLATLKAGATTKAELKATLGEPVGIGGARLMPDLLQEVWLYEFDELDGAKVRMRMLLVFVNAERGVYDGYLWFSSGQVLGQTK